jgi:chromosome segregation ATPase
MKLAEALILRADIRKRIEQLRNRLALNIQVQEGSTPHEDPQDLLEELPHLVRQFTDLVKQINRTNAATPFEEGMTLTDALAERDALAIERSVLSSAIQTVGQPQNRYLRSELRSITTVNLGQLQKQVDDLARRYRELDTRVQALNWAVDLIED